MPPIRRSPDDPHAGLWWYALWVEADGQDLWGIADRRTHRVVADESILPSFVRLANTDDPRRYEAFGQRWGPLWLCSHGLPHGHAARFGLPDLEEARLDPMSADLPDDVLLSMGCQARIPDGEPPSELHHMYETVLEWRTLAARAAAVLRIGRTLALGRNGSRKDWAVARSGLPGANPLWRQRYPLAAEPMHRRGMGSARRYVLIEDYRHLVDDFAEMTGVRPGLSGTFEVTLAGGDGHPLTRAIGGQLVAAASALFVSPRVGG